VVRDRFTADEHPGAGYTWSGYAAYVFGTAAENAGAARSLRLAGVPVEHTVIATLG
jgi:hypothetical protein